MAEPGAEKRRPVSGLPGPPAPPTGATPPASSETPEPTACLGASRMISSPRASCFGIVLEPGDLERPNDLVCSGQDAGNGLHSRGKGQGPITHEIEVGASSLKPLLSAGGTGGQRPDSRSLYLTSDNRRDLEPCFRPHPFVFSGILPAGTPSFGRGGNDATVSKRCRRARTLAVPAI